MPELTHDQQQRALEVMQEYLAAPANPDGRTPLEVQTELDRKREEIIDETLKPLVEDYLGGRVPLADFKSKVDGINKRNEYWGFKGIKGQMFFNMVVNVADDAAECDEELQVALTVPSSVGIASSKIKTFVSYVKRIGEQHLDAGGTKHGRPKFRIAPFFLSYFWQLQDRKTWPVYYTNSVNTMVDLNLWQPGEDLAENYLTYKQIHEQLGKLFSEKSGRPFGLYEVEHVFWFKGGNPFGEAKLLKPDQPVVSTVDEASAAKSPRITHLPDGYVPPIVSILPAMARHDPELIDAAKASGTSLDRAFEKSIHAAFTMLGYETKLLGQGGGRVPDGLAKDLDNSYAILWDGKVRADGYSMGTDDRTIREYIMTQSRELKRRSSLRNIYYMVVSSRFSDDYDDAIRMLKMDTDTSEVCLLEADALVALVDAKLRDPQQLPLGPDGLQRLFTVSGVITAQDVVETLG